MKHFLLCSIFLLSVGNATCFAGAFNFQEPTDWNVGDPGSVYLNWEAAVLAPFMATNTPPTASNVNPTISSTAGMSVQSPGFVAGSGGYYSFAGNYGIRADVYNHGGSSGVGSPYTSGYSTRVLVQTAATTNPDVDTSVIPSSIELVQLDGSPIVGGGNAELVGMTQLFLQEVMTPFGPAEQEELLFEFQLPSYADNFRVRFQSFNHSSFQELRVDTLLVANATPGDFDGDGDVDGNDLADWQASYSVDGGGDADNDNDSDGRDFLIWQRNYTGSLPSSAFAVPEPCSLLGLIAVCMCCIYSQRGVR